MDGDTDASMTLICKYLSWKEMVSMGLGFSCGAGRIQGFEPLLRLFVFVYTLCICVLNKLL